MSNSNRNQLLKKIENDYNNRNKKTTELEISFGNYIYPQKKFEASLTHNQYQKIFDTLKPNLKTQTEQKSVIYRLQKDPSQAYEIFFTPKFEITMHVKRDKTDKNTYNIPSKSARVSISNEKNTKLKTATNPTNLTFFRYKNRNSYTSKDKLYKNWRLDFTTGYQFQPETNKNLNQLIEETKTTHPTFYQIEIEYIPSSNSTNKPITSIEKIINSIVPTILPENPIPQLTNIFKKRTVSELMTQVTPVSIQNVNQLKTGYAVTEKADGLRLFLYFTSNSQQVTINKANQIDTPLTPTKNAVTTIKNTLLDTEYITALDKFLVFDILLNDNQDTTQLKFDERYEILKKLKLPKNAEVKKFLQPTKTLSIYNQAKKIYQPKKYPYELDGLIFTPTDKPYNVSSLKWKPIDEITVDFLITIATATNSNKNNKSTNKTTNKTKNIILKYYIVANKHQAKKQHLKIPSIKEVPFINRTKKFIPVEPPFTNTATIQVIKPTKTTPHSIYKPTNTIIENLTIVECQYDQKTEQWIPYRNRPDKTEQMLQSLNNTPPDFMGPNGYRTAESNWQLIQNPITVKMITGEEKLPEIYYTGTEVKNSQIKNMNAFHHYVKNYLYFTFSKRAPKPLHMLELSGGRGGDLPTIAKLKPATLVFTDFDEPSLIQAKGKWERLTKPNTPPSEFIKLDLRENNIDKLEKVIKSDVSMVSSQFAFHYMWETKKSFTNIFNLINTFLQKNGIFIMTTFDGETVKKLLSSNKSMALYSNTNANRLLFKIDKKYSNKNNNSNPFGKKIDVFGETIGEHPEYLVDYNYLIEHFTKNGYKLLETSMFTKILPRWEKKTGRTLTEPEKNFSSLNRYAVFQKL